MYHLFGQAQERPQESEINKISLIMSYLFGQPSQLAQEMGQPCLITRDSHHLPRSSAKGRKKELRLDRKFPPNIFLHFPSKNPPIQRRPNRKTLYAGILSQIFTRPPPAADYVHARTKYDMLFLPHNLILIKN